MTSAYKTLSPLAKTAPPVAENTVVRTQLALIRSISDELARGADADPISRALRAQLDDEVARLDRIVAELLPESGVHEISLPRAG